MRRKHSLIVLLIVLALLAGVYAYFSSSRATSREEEQIEQERVIEISKLDKEEIEKIVLENKNTPEELIFERQVIADEKQAIHTNKNDQFSEQFNDETLWINTKPYPVELNQSRIEDLLESFSFLTAEAVVEDQTQNLSKYGLANPSATGTAYLEDGTKLVLHLGNKTADGTAWYLMKQGDPKLYAVDNLYGKLLSSSFSDFRKKELPTIDPALISYLQISGEGRREVEIKKQNHSEEQYIYGAGTFLMTKPYKGIRGVAKAKLTEILDNLNGLIIEEFVDDHPTDYNKYGLDQPRLQLIARDENNTILDLSFGNCLEDGMVYFKTSDSDGVYLMDESVIEFLNFEPFDLADKSAMYINIDNLGKVTLEAGAREHTLSITRTATESEANGQLLENHFLDGKKVEEELFKDLYQSLVGISIDAEQAHRAQGSPELKITYYLTKGWLNAQTLELYPYDKDFYSLVLNGNMESEFLVYRSQLNWILDNLDYLTVDSSFG